MSHTPITTSTENLGAGDSHVVQDLLPADLSQSTFDSLRSEVQWNVMHHRGGEVPRLVAVQGHVAEDGSYPIYRHPADESPPLLPFSPTVALIRSHVEKVISHPVNHVLIQHYRSGADYISEHSDKTIDVVRGSNIVNVSLGAQRTMTLRLKKDAFLATDEAQNGEKRPSQKFPLPHNSMFVMGMETNKGWLHAINHDKRPQKTKSEAEQAFNGERISLTFRHIGTFLTADGKRIYGQGATTKSKEDAREVINGTDQAQKLIDSFGFENQQSDFDWDKWYGPGSDVLHFTPHDK